MNKFSFCTMLCALLVVLPVYADIYKWVDAQGTVHYSDNPGQNAERAELPSLQAFDRQNIPKQTQKTAATPESSGLNIAIIRPLPEETFRDGRGLVTAQAAISPNLTANQTLIFYLDGTPTASSPTRNTSIQLEAIPRGEHQLSVAVVSADKEISRSPPVVFYMKPPTALTPVNQTAPRPPEQQPAGATTAPPTTRAPGTLAAPRFGTSSGPAGSAAGP